jgi:hypothetical protein
MTAGSDIAMHQFAIGSDSQVAKKLNKRENRR